MFVKPRREHHPRLKHLWLDAGYDEGRGKRRWAEEILGLSVEEGVRKSPKPVAEKVARIF